MLDTSQVVVPSAQFVLDAIRDSHRHQCAFAPEADPTADLRFDSSVADWRDACDLVRADDLGVALNELWQVDVSREDWRAVLEPAGQRTLRDVCGLIAAHAQQRVIVPGGSLGGSCRAAGAFLTIRSLLLRAGADPTGLRPSAAVDELAKRFPEVFLGPISQLAPGRLPTVAIQTPWHNRSVGLFCLGLMGLAVAAGMLKLGAPFATHVAWVAGGCAVGGYLATFFTARLRPKTVRFGSVVTFRDLAETIAGNGAV